MRRGEVWWAEFDERRPVVLLSGEDPSGFQAMQVVAPADTDISGWGIEVAVGVQEGLPFDGVLRFAFRTRVLPGHLADHLEPGRPDRAGRRGVCRQAQRDRRRPAYQRAKDGVDPGRGGQVQRDQGLPPPADSGRPRSSVAALAVAARPVRNAARISTDIGSRGRASTLLRSSADPGAPIGRLRSGRWGQGFERCSSMSSVS